MLLFSRKSGDSMIYRLVFTGFLPGGPFLTNAQRHSQTVSISLVPIPVTIYNKKDLR